VNIPPPEYTPISSIPRDSFLSSQSLNFEGSVAIIGDYDFDKRTRSIEKRSTKRKRGEDFKSKSHVGRILEWKVGPDPEENAVQEASVLNTFAGLNASSVLEVTNSLNISRTRVIEMETELKDVKDQFNIDVQEAASVAESINSGKINGSLQAQRDHLNEEFEKRMKILWDTHRDDLEVEKHKLSVSLENTITSTGTVESIKAQVLVFTEDLSKVKNELLGLLIDI
jgi:hypothetical protein